MASIFKITMTPDAENPVAGDIQFANGQFVGQPDGPAMIVQRIWCRLRWWRGEWYIDQRQGTPWSSMLGKGGSVENIERILTQLIESTPGVGSVNTISVTLNADRTATINFEASSEDEAYPITVEQLALPYGVGGIT